MDVAFNWAYGFFSFVMGLTNDLGDYVDKTPSEWNSSLWSLMESISETIILPVGYVILGYFFLMELYNYLTSVTTQSEFVIWEPIKIFLRIAVIKAVMENTFMILDAIFNAVNLLVSKIGITSVNISDLSTAGIEDAYASVDGFFSKWFMLIGMWIAGVVGLVLYVATFLMILRRLLELCVYTAIAPIPMATLANGELGIGKNFLKSYVAVCLEGLIMVLLLLIFSKISVATGAFGSGVVGEVVAPVVTLGALAFCFFKSSSWAKSILNAT